MSPKWAPIVITHTTLGADLWFTNWDSSYVFTIKFDSIGAGVQWNNINVGVSVDDDFTMLHVIVMLFVDAFIYAVVTWYVEAVWPGDYGIPQPWYFPLRVNTSTLSFKKYICRLTCACILASVYVSSVQVGSYMYTHWCIHAYKLLYTFIQADIIMYTGCLHVCMMYTFIQADAYVHCADVYVSIQYLCLFHGPLFSWDLLSFYLMCQRSYWCGTSSSKNHDNITTTSDDDELLLDGHEQRDLRNSDDPLLVPRAHEYFELEPDSLVAGIRIVNLRKVWIIS